ncbi:nicotinate-nucleotide--dimethylbenzimidazole phosphoribosyltransferase [Streptomyces sp. CB01881]|uniref:nicotinate-nucleotide--dimethylbenzimidazole phosphoribosyltransferase n=1 Tax=Streptomyces sp. CB01881 TaxID=2078691 RepID=UPI000CDC0514|nr:nicotinate-nucleotide--dimethylbenzimidazole phosphoribosyltransferase [Streptomyces sp. CB01881]AUY52072.1 nicotinate-nucleotide--dimethylbenzimidazole phosphoribosyltransferase [Streptomyces sp. CB01881]TYC71499.1 nicotinate-nucleotide--dimethylbenzimidazole phosphoribosyltransferase [Streptomyces sp. CB01881]
MDTTVDLDTFSSLVERPDESARRAAEERWRTLDRPRGGLGRLEELGSWLSSVQGRSPVQPLSAPKVLLFAADHGVAALGVSRLPARGGTAARVRAVLDGTAPVALLARRFGAGVRVVDVAVDADPSDFPDEVVAHRVRRGSGRIDREDALTPEETVKAFRAGMAVADEEADAGTDLVVLGDLGVGSTTVAAVLVGALCGTDAAAVTGRGSGIDDKVWMVKCAAIRDSLRRARPVLGDQLALLGATGGADFAAITGFLLQAAVRRLPVVLDGVVSSACALVAQRIAFRAPEWWRAGQSSGEPAQAKAYDRLTLTPLQEQGITMGEGVGALMALPLLQAAADSLAEHKPAATAAPVPKEQPKLPSAAELLGRV